MKRMIQGSLDALRSTVLAASCGALAGALLVPYFQIAQGASSDEAAATAAVLLAMFYCVFRATDLSIRAALTRNIRPEPVQHGMPRRALMPLALASICFLLLMDGVVAIGLASLIFSPVGIDLQWAFGRAVGWLQWLGAAATIVVVMSFAYIGGLLLWRHWQRVREEVSEMRIIIESELLGTIGSSRRKAF